MAVQMRTMLAVADNSGARKLQVILPLGGSSGIQLNMERRRVIERRSHRRQAEANADGDAPSQHDGEVRPGLGERGPSLGRGLLGDLPGAAGVVPAGSGITSLAFRQRYCAYMAPPIIATVLPSSACAASDDPASTTTPAPSLPTGND